MPVSSSTEHWIKPDALTINLNHFGDPDYLQVSVLAGAVVMAFKQDVIGYNAAHNYRTWPLEAANTYLETSSAYNVYARLTRSEVNARALVIYDPILRDIEGREITYNKHEEIGEEKEILGEPNEDFYFIFLGQISSSISSDGRTVLREWTSEYRSGSLETNEQQNDWMAILNKMFRPHYDDPLNPDLLTWIEAKAHMGIAGGLTSFIDNGSFKLPSIYDGLPIDNQTLKWVEVTEQVGTDEEGNPIYETYKKLKAQGGGSGGGVADSVHWNDIEGKPNFDDYATQDALKDYLPLSGGTMTGQINMPVGIGNAIKFGEESRLFASNGTFYISAETHLVFASGASGNNVPNNVVINKDGRMFIANNLAVGHAGFIMDSYKLNVAGDAYVNGKLVVNGTIYPSISSLFNIGDPSERFACVYADSVDVGGVKIRLLQDGVLLIDGNLAVTGGITSYVDGGDLDLPSIYDGLPIDGDTLYWVLDENGKKVMLKSKGDNNEGGGSVKFPLSWSGFSNGSWDGSEEKTIEIPAKLSELENDGKFFADGGWIGSDANSVTFGSYLYGGYAANIPKNVGQLLAFNNGDLESWNRGSQIFIEGENFYYRQFWDNYWRNWRRVISGNADGVIDYDLTLGGSLNMPSVYSQIQCGEKDLLECYSGTDTYLHGENNLYLVSNGLYTLQDGAVYKILHEGNYRNYEYTAKGLNVVDIRDTTPKPSDIDTFAVSAQFTNTDNPGGGWYSGFSIQGWTNDYKAWQLRSGAWGFASDHLYFRNGVLETWNDWRRVITGDVNGVLDFNLELKGEEGGNIKFVYNNDSAITTNKPNDIASIRHALRFPWYGEAYEIGTIRGNAAHSDGFGITHQNNHLVWKVNTKQMDVYGDLRVNNGLIQYNEEGGYFYLEGNLVVSGGISSYVDVGNLNLPSIYDGLPVDKTTIGWKEVTDASGAKSKVLGIIGDIDDAVMWSDIEGIPSWIGASKPSYSYSEISGTPDLSLYALKENIPSLSGYATVDWVEKQKYAKSSDLSEYLPLSGVLPDNMYKEFTLQGNLRLKDKSSYGRKLIFGDGEPPKVYLYEQKEAFLSIYAHAGMKIYTQATNYIELAGKGIKVNNGIITYNESEGYFVFDGNLLVTGGITAFSDSGAGNQWILDATALSGVTSTSQYKVYSANVTTMLAKKVTSLETKLSAIKTAFNGLSDSSSAAAIVSALKTLASKL